MKYKEYILTFISLILIIKIGSILLKETKFYNIYSSVSGIVTCVFVLSILVSCNMNINNISTNDNITDTTTQNSIIDQFQNNLQLLIKKDLHNTFYVNVTVYVETDLEHLKINILGNLSDKSSQIKNYVFEKYCSEGDEVIVTNEYY